jgi:hypothetical protein
MTPRLIPGDDALEPDELTAEQLATYFDILERGPAWTPRKYADARAEARRLTALVYLLRSLDR